MAKQITCLGALKLARWLLATLVVCLAVELWAGEPAVVSHWESQLRKAAVLRDQPSVTPTLEGLLSDAADGQLGAHGLMPAALIASSIDNPVQLRDYQRRVDSWRDDLKRGGNLRGSNLDRARAIHGYLHTRVFTGGYRDDATDLTNVFQTGEFNCVSSAVCFLALARELGVSATAVELPGHCLIELPTADGIVEIETTCREWFEVLDSPRRRREMLHRVTGYEHRSQQQRRRINEVQLLGILFYNRGVEQLNREQYRQSAEANLLALRVDPTNQIAQGNLLAALNNWALDINEAGRYAEALDLLQAALRIAPDHTNFRTNEIHITQNWIDDALASDRWQEALRIADDAAERRPQEAYYRAARWNILERQAEAYLAAGRRAAVVEMFDHARSRFPHEAEPRKIEVGVWNRYAVAQLDAGHHRAALAILDFARLRLPHSVTLRNNHAAIISRWTHEALSQNDFAAAKARASYGGDAIAKLPEAQRQLWRYCCEQELAAQLKSSRSQAAATTLAEAIALDPANPRWELWAEQIDVDR